MARCPGEAFIVCEDPANRRVQCPDHGDQGVGLVCTHVAHASLSGEAVGFYWGDDEDLARPDAWCQACEDALVALDGTNCEQWFLDGEFKVFCAACWDDAKRICGGA